WMAVGVVMPRAASTALSGAGTPRASNVAGAAADEVGLWGRRAAIRSPNVEGIGPAGAGMGAAARGAASHAGQAHPRRPLYLLYPGAWPARETRNASNAWINHRVRTYRVGCHRPRPRPHSPTGARPGRVPSRDGTRRSRGTACGPSFERRVGFGGGPGNN